ncbi:hypothetical protein [Dactylosporangium sp. NPDC051484]|uniref:hypothetical protein n=1 Tax=Dactylosporangium sp. NPDC051484 TaxID=3154942 RepID=UPI00344DA00E
MSEDGNDDIWTAARRSVETQRNFLRNPLPAGAGICAVCRGAVEPRFEFCYPCRQHRHASGGRLADVVVPIAYAVKNGQHAHNLAAYKAPYPSRLAQRSLSALGIMFLRQHWKCLAEAAGGPLTHATIVPSTRGRRGPHPVEIILASRVGLPMLQAMTSSAYSSEDRDFHRDRFFVPPGRAAKARVLLLDDTWTNGGRLQSLAFALKDAGAAAVAAVILGRHVNPAFGPSAPMMGRLRSAQWFDVEQCCLEPEGR